MFCVIIFWIELRFNKTHVVFPKNMDPKSGFFLNFRRFVSNPTLEYVKVLKDVSDNEIHQLVLMNQESLVLSAIFTTIAELKTRYGIRNKWYIYLFIDGTSLFSGTNMK